MDYAKKLTKDAEARAREAVRVGRKGDPDYDKKLTKRSLERADEAVRVGKAAAFGKREI